MKPFQYISRIREYTQKMGLDDKLEMKITTESRDSTRAATRDELQLTSSR